MSDYNINAQITGDSSGYVSAVDKAKKASKNLSKSISSVIQGLGKNGLVGAFGAVGLASTGLTATLGSVVKIARQVSQTIGECTDAYKKQAIAERTLDTAIQNNPFVTGSSSKALKEFASEMQKVSNYGDEELIPMMANLVSLGRTETETMQIMSVAMDMSAGMGISLDTAISQLNATLNGNIGRLGQQNKELKNLTEEELKNGKAIDILGQKFKGLSQATADTSKQLKNIKGDFKEALGQFTLPSSDMWNKFWTGFYSNGIEIINKFNDYLDTQIIGKRILENLNSNAQAVSKATGASVNDILSDFRYLKEQLSYLSDSELRTLLNTLERQKERTEAEERMLTVVKQITQSRKLQLEQDKKDAEAEAKKAAALTEQQEIENGIVELKNKHLKKIAEQEARWENIKKVTGEEVSLEEKLKFYQDDLVSIMTEAGGQISTNNQYYKDQMAIINNILAALGKTELKSAWDDKLLDQRIEMLESEKEMAVKNAEETGEETYLIERDYNEKLLNLKLEKLNKEKEEALLSAENSEEDILKIQEYYKNEEEKIYNELGQYKKKKNKEEQEDTKKTFALILENTKKYTANVAKVFSSIADTVKNVFSGIGNVFNKLLNIFSFDPDDALTNLLKVEDLILTFFVETLPRLPKFFESALQSVLILLKNLVTGIDWEKVQEVINSIVDMVIEYAPEIIQNLLTVVINVAQTLLNGLIHFVESGGWKMLLDMLLTIQKRLEEFIVDNIDEIVQTIVDMLPDLVQFLIDSVVSASKTLTKLIKPLIKLIMAIIEALFDFILSDEIFDSAIEVMLSLIEAINEELLPRIAYLIPKLIVKIIGFIVKNLPKLVAGIVEGLIKSFFTVNWFDVVKQIFMGFIDGFKDLFGIHSPSTLFEGFGQNIIEGLVEGLKGLAESLNTMLMPLYDFVVNVIGKIIDAFDTIGNQVNKLTNSTFKGFVEMIKASGAPMRTMGKVTIAVMGAIGQAIADIHNELRDIILSVTTIKVWTPWKTYEIGGVDIGQVSSPNMDNYIRLMDALKDGTDNARKGLALVGEAGPELVQFNGGERVLNNRNTNKALEEMGSGKTINQNITFNNLQDTTAYAMLRQLKQYNRQMAINGIL